MHNDILSIWIQIGAVVVRLKICNMLMISSKRRKGVIIWFGFFGMLLFIKLKLSNKMQTFAYWHAYFDSIFLKSTPKLSSSFVKDMQLERVVQTPWVKCSFLPQLTTLLEFLQKFIINTDWKHSNCSELETAKIQSQLNNLLCLLQAQKVYGRQYWRQSERRVQASVVHHFMYLKMLILAIIPQSCRNVNEALASKKLCIQISKIEDLINHYLQSLRQVYVFLHREKFAEQKSLTKQLFQAINRFWQKLPQLTKSQLSQIPKIMRYICLNNPLDSSPEKVQSNNLLQLRKKSETIENNGRIAKNKRSESCFDRKSDRFVSRGNQKCYDSTGKTESKQLKSDKNKKLTFFKFKHEVITQKSPNKSQKLQKSNTIVSHQTIKNTISPPRLDRFRSTTFIPQQFSAGLKSKASPKDIRLTVQKPRFGGQMRDRMVTKTVYSDLSIDKNKFLFEKCEQQQLQRRAKKKVIKNAKQKIKFNTISNFIQLQTGKVKGWGKIRQNITQKIVKNKLKKLLLA